MKTIMTHIVDTIMRCVYHLYARLARIKKQILFESFNGEQYSDNPRAISEALHELYPDYKIIWFLKRKNNKYDITPEYIEIINKRRDYYRAAAVSFCVVRNTQFNGFIRRRKHQLFIQTWHGDRGFKKILLDSKPAKPCNDGFVTNLCVAGSKFGEKIFKSAFDYQGETICVGCPRNDALLNNSVIKSKQVVEALHLPKNKKILLYAPTFRDNRYMFSSDELDLNLVLDELERDGEEWVCLIRSHLYSQVKIDSDNRVIDVSDYPDMKDILCITDFLLTDYSSSCCDLSLTITPIVLLLFDKERYINESREFYVDPETVGFYVAHNMNELITVLKHTSPEDFIKANQRVNDFYEISETGNASRIIADKINDYYNNNKGYILG